MNSQHKNISVFEELIRILDLRKRSLAENVDDVVPFYDNNKYIPGKERSEKLINELVDFQKRNKPRKRFLIYFITILISSLLILSFILCLKYCNKPEKVIRVQLDEKQGVISIQNNFMTEDTNTAVTNKKNHFEKAGSSKINRQIPLIADTNKILFFDTVQNPNYQTDTIIYKTLINDTNRAKNIESEEFSGYYCSLPQKFSFCFKEKAYHFDEQYNPDITEIAEKIRNCRNLDKIEIIGYYTQKFLIFNNKKLVTKRINEIKNEIRKQDVSSRTFGKSEVNFIKFDKTNNPELSQCIEIILNN